MVKYCASKKLEEQEKRFALYRLESEEEPKNKSVQLRQPYDPSYSIELEGEGEEKNKLYKCKPTCLFLEINLSYSCLCG